MADLNYGPNGVYRNIPDVDGRGRPGQLSKFIRWNSDPVGNDASNLSSVSPQMQRVIARARADNPNLNFVIGNGRRSAADQDLAKNWGWSRVGSQDGGDALVHMNGNAVDLWGLDGNGRVQFDPGQQKQIANAVLAAAKAEGVNLNWGGNWKSFKDAPHFELAGGGTAENAGAPESHAAVTPSGPSQPTPGTTLNSNAIIDTLGKNIAQIESGGFKNPYSALNPTTHAIGKYQVMPSNVPGWTLAATGKSMTPDEFRASPSAQEAVFRDQMQRNLQLYSPKDAASIWFTGKPFNVAGGSVMDANRTTNASYVARATQGLSDAGTFTPGAAVAASQGASGAPNLTAGGSSAPAAPTQPGAAQAALPGFQAGSPAEKSMLAGAKQLGLTGGGGSGQDQGPQLPPAPSIPQAQAMGGPMMMGPGGVNQFPRQLAGQYLQAQGFQTMPSLAAFAPHGVNPPVQAAPPGQATGLPSMPGTTLNSPSQIQMALMTGAMNPYDLYSGGYGYQQGSF